MISGRLESVQAPRTQGTTRSRESTTASSKSDVCKDCSVWRRLDEPVACCTDGGASGERQGTWGKREKTKGSKLAQPRRSDARRSPTGHHARKDLQ